MAAVTVTSGYPKVYSLGDKALYIWRVSSVDDTDTLDTGLGTRVIDVWASFTGNASTQASAGGNITLTSDDLVTFYPGEDGNTATVFVIADGA